MTRTMADPVVERLATRQVLRALWPKPAWSTGAIG